MKTTLVYIFVLLQITCTLLVESAPLNSKTKAKITTNPEATLSEKEKKEEQFENFFESLNPKEFDNAINDIKSVFEVDGDGEETKGDKGTLLQEKKEKVTNESTTKVVENGKGRKRRSLIDTMNNTMMRVRSSTSHDYRSYWQRQRQAMCRRRCYWKRMFYLCRYGEELRERCYC